MARSSIAFVVLLLILAHAQESFGQICAPGVPQPCQPPPGGLPPPPGGGGLPPPGGGGGGGGGGQATSGRTASTSCTVSSGTCTGSNNYNSKAGLIFNTSVGIWQGTFVTNLCPRTASQGNAQCIAQTIPAPNFTTTPAAAPLRGVVAMAWRYRILPRCRNLFSYSDRGFLLS
jgi:hypothetical protein